MLIQILLSLLSAGCCIALIVRAFRTRRQIVESLGLHVGADDFLQCAYCFICNHLDSSLLQHGAAEAFLAIPVRAREHQDSYRTLAELLPQLRVDSNPLTFQSLVDRGKFLYQIQATLEAPAEDLAPSLEILSREMQAVTCAGKQILRVEAVQPDSALDRNSMMPLSNGMKVKQPLGVIVYGSDGRVLQKAKVLCY